MGDEPLRPADELLVVLDKCEHVIDEVQSGRRDLRAETLRRVRVTRNGAAADLAEHAARYTRRLIIPD